MIIKSGAALEKMGKVDVIAFDKTGTLTCGRLEVCNVLPFDAGLDEDGLLTQTAAAEGRSEHPLGKAIVACAKKRQLRVPAAIDFRMTAGRGISAQVEGRHLLCGNASFLREQGVSIDGIVEESLGRLRHQGKAIILIAEKGRCIGLIALADVLRPEAGAMTERLAAMGTRTVLLTGDHKTAADYFAKQAGMTDVQAELLPEEKVERIRAFQQEGHRVCMIGDGVNDAPALKTADVSVAMGHMGSDIAVDAAEVALMCDDLSQIPYLKRLSDATVKTIKASITLSMCINLVAIILSLMEVLTPTTGALVHNAGSCFVVLIAALLYDRKFE